MKIRFYSETIAEAIKNHLQEEGWKFSFDENFGVFKFVLTLKGTLKRINYLIMVKDKDYSVYVTAPIGVDAENSEMMANMAEFICRTNYELKNGHLELDMSDGEIRFKVFVDCSGIVPSEEMVKNSIRCPAAVYEHYGRGITGVIFEGLSGKEAYKKCEDETKEILRSLMSDGALGDKSDVEAMIKRIASALEKIEIREEDEEAEDFDVLSKAIRIPSPDDEDEDDESGAMN